MARDLAAEQFDLGSSDQQAFRRTSACFAAALTEAVLIGVVEEPCLGSEKFDSAPLQANPVEQANLGRLAIYGTALDTPQEPSSVTVIILPIASRDACALIATWTLPGAGTLPLIFSGT